MKSKKVITLTYNHTIDDTQGKSETKFQIPNLKWKMYILSSFKITSNEKRTTYEIKLNGKELLLNIGEAVISQTDTFDLSTKLSQIVESNDLVMSIRNMYPLISKECKKMDILNFTFYYKYFEGYILYNNVFTNLDSVNNTILENIKSGYGTSKVNYVDFISPSLDFEFVPLFSSTDDTLKTYSFIKGTYRLNYNSEQWNQFFKQINFYKIVFKMNDTDNQAKFSTIVTGYLV